MDPQRRQALVEVLNRILAAEYGVLWLLPRHVALVEDEEVKRQLRLIGDVELEHAEKSAQMIYALGAEPTEEMPNFRPRRDLLEILETHLADEQRAIALYGEALAIAEEPAMRRQLEEMQREEEGHQRLIERTLARVREAGGS